MITELKNNDGFVYAYCEWEILDDKGQFKDWGEYLYIQRMWIHKLHRGKKTLQHLISLIDKHKFLSCVKWVYWNRDKYNDRISKLFSRNRLSKMGG